MRRFKSWIKRALYRCGYEIISTRRVCGIPDSQHYRRFASEGPLFAPWIGYPGWRAILSEITPYTLLSPERLYILFELAMHSLRLNGEVWECGVYRGGSALMLAKVIEMTSGSCTVLRLFDTFEGMPAVDERRDVHKKGDFADTSLDEVRKIVGHDNHVVFYQGIIPETFRGRESARIAFAHIDVDIYNSVRDCCEFIYPRLCEGGLLIFDDYGFPSCPGARKAVDEFFESRVETPIVLPTGQALVIRLADGAHAI